MADQIQLVFRYLLASQFVYFFSYLSNHQFRAVGLDFGTDHPDGLEPQRYHIGRNPVRITFLLPDIAHQTGAEITAQHIIHHLEYRKILALEAAHRHPDTDRSLQRTFHRHIHPPASRKRGCLRPMFLVRPLPAPILASKSIIQSLAMGFGEIPGQDNAAILGHILLLVEFPQIGSFQSFEILFLDHDPVRMFRPEHRGIESPAGNLRDLPRIDQETTMFLAQISIQFFFRIDRMPYHFFAKRQNPVEITAHARKDNRSLVPVRVTLYISPEIIDFLG